MAESFKLAKSKSLTTPSLWIVVGVFFLVLVAVFTRTSQPDTTYDRGQPVRQSLTEARQINQMMWSYASDHNGVYPTGKSSTEIFQKLIDEKYCDDPAIFFGETLKIPNKTKATSNVLKPENVCWDVTVPLDLHSDDSLPVVFSTGYRINYVASGNAAPLFSSSENRLSGVAVCYHGNNAAFLKKDWLSNGTIMNFISPNFHADGKKYQQLTPDGPLAP